MPNPFDRIAISETELAPFVSHPKQATGALPEEPSQRYGGQAGLAHGLLSQQKGVWELLRNGYHSLQSVRTRSFDFNGFQIKVQFNPGRLISTSAKVDTHSIRERKCFLCTENLPPDQRGLACDGEYLVLCNPFPIFPEHFTIVFARHAPQRILSAFSTFLDYTRRLGDRYTVFYNGPKCGASAPDHLHFQAGNRSFLPIDTDFEAVTSVSATRLYDSDDLRVRAVDSYLRHFVSFESADAGCLERAFSALYEIMLEGTAPDEEPMLNILGFYQNSAWRIVVFPRAKHRPAFYFREGEQQLLISPAAVELGGVCTTPREQDFEQGHRGKPHRDVR